ncbi:MAG: hypothetical protein WBS19_11285 [Candidatus Korobacteraceae bacterium]
MDTILQIISRSVDELLGRASGPLHFRVFLMPIVVTIIAIRAELRDAREGRPVPLGEFFIKRTELRRLFRSAVEDVGKVFIVAVVLDTVYQLFVLRAFHIGELLIVAVGCAVLPYVLVRGPITSLLRFLYQKRTKRTVVACTSATAGRRCE